MRTIELVNLHDGTFAIFKNEGQIVKIKLLGSTLYNPSEDWQVVLSRFADWLVCGEIMD